MSQCGIETTKAIARKCSCTRNLRPGATGYCRVRVVPNDVIDNVAVRRLTLHPRYSDHQHPRQRNFDVLELSEGQTEHEINERKCRDLWVQWTESRFHTIRFVASGIPRFRSSNTGLFRRVGGGIHGCCTWHIRSGLLQEEEKNLALSTFGCTINVLFVKRKHDDIGVSLIVGDPEAIASGVDGWPVEFTEHSLTQHASIPLDTGFRIHARVDLDQTVMGYNVDTTTLSVMDELQQGFPESGGGNVGGP